MIALGELLAGMIAMIPADANADGLAVSGVDVTMPIETRFDRHGFQASAPRGRLATGFDAPLGQLSAGFTRGPR